MHGSTSGREVVSSDELDHASEWDRVHLCDLTFMGESPDGANAPAEDGIDCTWSITASEWATPR